MRFGPGRIQKPVTGPEARTGNFSMREMRLEEEEIAGVAPCLDLQTIFSTRREAGKIDQAGWAAVRLRRNWTIPDPEWEN